MPLLQMVEDANELSGAMGQAAREADSWANQTQLLNEQWSEFKSIIGAGLVTVLKPVVSFMNTLLAGMIRLANTVGTVLSNLFGIEWEDMTASDSISDTTDSTDDLTDSTSDAADATDDLADATDDLTDATEDAAAAQKSLMEFDEIAKLTAATASSGSGGSGSGSGSSDDDSTDSTDSLGNTSSLVDSSGGKLAGQDGKRAVRLG